jgi:hypothetical protein
MRREDWPERLDAFIEARRNVPFAWGQQDCVLFAADAIQAMTDADPLADVRGHWGTATAAARLLKDRGGLAAAVRGVLGKPIPYCLAQRGDILLLELIDGELALGVCVGAEGVGPARNGLIWVPMDHAHMAWRINDG